MTFDDKVDKLEVGTETPTENSKCAVAGYGKTSNSAETEPGIKAFLLEVVIKTSDTCSATKGQICAGVSDEKSKMTKALCEVSGVIMRNNW